MDLLPASLKLTLGVSMMQAPRKKKVSIIISITTVDLDMLKTTGSKKLPRIAEYSTSTVYSGMVLIIK
jgi:hypothetical protein